MKLRQSSFRSKGQTQRSSHLLSFLVLSAIVICESSINQRSTKLCKQFKLVNTASLQSAV